MALNRDVPRHDPGSQFIKAFVSAKKLDAVSKKGPPKSASYFRRWEDLANSSHEIIFHSSGRFITREQSTQSPCWGSILDDEKSQHRFLLSYLANRPVVTAMADLQRRKGMCPKSAAATLNFNSFRRRVFVVDTHLARR
jgi:endonuclease III